jgi:hypothetical protein
LRVFAGQPLKHEEQPSRMIRAALVVAAARAAAPLDAATTKRLDQLQALLHQSHATPLPTWTVSHEDADAIDWAPLANGSAKAVEAGEWRGTRVVRKRVACADPITTLARTHKQRKRPLPKMEKHFAEAVAELYFMEHLRGLLCGNQPVRRVLGDDVAALAPLSGEEPASLRHRAGVASMAWRS